MRQVYGVATVLLLSAVTFSSCTCEKDVPPLPASSMKETAPGFHVAGANKTPQHKAPTAPPQEVAAAPTPTAPVEIPKDFPVPVFEGAAVAQVQSLANDAHNVIFRTNAPLNDIYNFYQDKLTHDGWKPTQQFQRAGHAFLSFKKGDMVANVTIAQDLKDPAKQILAVMYEQQKPLEFDEF